MFASHCLGLKFLKFHKRKKCSMNKKLIKTRSVDRKKKEKEKENLKDDTSNLI